MERRVVVTGVGLVTPLGVGTGRTWENICAGVSGVDTITRFDTSDYGVKIAAEIKEFHTEDFFEKKSAKHLDLFVQYGIVAARFALQESGFTVTEENCGRVGVITGCGMGGLPTIARQHGILEKKGPRKVNPFFIPMAIPNMPSGNISIDIGSKGPNLTLTTACTAGTHAVGEAYNYIKSGRCDVVIGGGTEAVICGLGIAGFSSMKALSTRNDDPAAASRPFDKDRDGFVMGEGAGMLILEEYEQARARGAQIYAEVVGYGVSSDAFHIAAPPEDGAGAVRAMKDALAGAGMKPEDIDYINAHGTSTPLNDRGETRAIKTVFGDHAYKLVVNSTKSMTGHLLGAAGGIESAFLALAIRDQISPPTINLDTVDPDCDLDYAANSAREMKIDAGLSNSFGFGGTNGSVIMKRI